MFVYFNIRDKVFSGREKGIVTCHPRRIHLTDCTFKVSEAGRRRVLEEKRKNVHAGVDGEPQYLSCVVPSYETGWRKATYNPYKYESFVDYQTKDAIFEADEAILEVSQGIPTIWYRNEE